jgi:hypothetical protein
MNMLELLVSEFESDLQILFSLQIDRQIEIFNTLNPKVDTLFTQMESLDEEALIKFIVIQVNIAKEKRNQAIRQGATDKTDSNWMSAAMLEHIYNSILSGDEKTVMHISKRLMKWMRDVENLI